MNYGLTVRLAARRRGVHQIDPLSNNAGDGLVRHATRHFPDEAGIVCTELTYVPGTDPGIITIVFLHIPALEPFGYLFSNRKADS